MENDFSALKSIQELKNLLDSGAINQQEYEALKRKIIFGNNPSSTVTTPPQAPPPVAPVRPEMPRTVSPPPVQTVTHVPSVESNPLSPEYQRVPNANAGTTSYNNKQDDMDQNEKFSSLTFNLAEEPTEEKRKDWLLTILITLAVILLIGLVAYQLFSDSESERLTSKSGPDTEETLTGETTITEGNTEVASAKPEPTTVDSARLNTAKEPTPPANAPNEAAAPETNTTPAAESPAVVATEAPTPAATPKLSEEDAINKMKDRLQAYYNDIKSAPFAAQNHFAPTVERYYTLIGTTPQAINENISSFHFNEFQDSQSSIEDGSLKLTNSGENGYEVTYIEHGTAFRKSKGQKQETTARVRARFDKDFKLTYFRQEQLLENRFIEE